MPLIPHPLTSLLITHYLLLVIMFTGIITSIASITKVTEENKSLFVTISRPEKWQLTEGMSIAVNGVCSTVRTFDDENFTVEYMPETIARTTVKNFRNGISVNLESTLHLGDEMSGHMVQGHVDDIGTVRDISIDGASRVVCIDVSQKLLRYIVMKGSITVDGVSLTVSALDDKSFCVSLVSHTLKHTTLGQRAVGDSVNIEVDMIAKYVEKQIKGSVK